MTTPSTSLSQLPRAGARLVALAAVAAALVAADASAVTRRAFVTSVSGTGNLATWPGSSGADALARGDSICRARAMAADLPNAATYRAWLSTTTTDAYCHVQGLTGQKPTCNGAPQPGGGPWYLVNGITPFTGDLAAIGSSNEVYRPVILDENGDETANGALIWTGTQFDGNGVAANCSNWTASTGVTGASGRSNWAGYGWSYHDAQACDEPGRLLCLEPGPSQPFDLGWQPSAIVFVTSVDGNGNLASWPEAGGAQGIAAGDAICQTFARRAALPAPESFRAWLSSQAADAIDRITVDATFRRLDHYPIANSRADLLDGFASNSLHVDEEGRYVGGRTMTGTGADGMLAAGATCDDWTSASSDDHARMGGVGAARNGFWTEWAFVGCNADSRLYCFQNQVTVELPLFADGFEVGSTDRWSD